MAVTAEAVEFLFQSRDEPIADVLLQVGLKIVNGNYAALLHWLGCFLAGAFLDRRPSAGSAGAQAAKAAMPNTVSKVIEFKDPSSVGEGTQGMSGASIIAIRSDRDDQLGRKLGSRDDEP